MSRHKKQIIIFEGTDGVGKTTAAKLLQEIMRQDYGIAVGYLKGMGSDNIFGRLAKKFPSTILFLAEAAWNMMKIDFFKEEVILMDRSYISVISHWPDVGSRLNRMIIALARPVLSRICWPHLWVYLFSGLDAQLLRIEKLANNPFHLALLSNPGRIAERNILMERFIDEANHPALKIDTTSLPASEVVRTIINFLKL